MSIKKYLDQFADVLNENDESLTLNPRTLDTINE